MLLHYWHHIIVDHDKSAQSLWIIIPPLITALTILVTAILTLRKYGLQRENQTKLNIEIITYNYVFEGQDYVYLDTILNNVGKVKLGAKYRFDNKGHFAYNDENDPYEKTLQYSLELQVKRVNKNLYSSYWFEMEKQYSKIDNLNSINLLDDFEVPNDPKAIFYIEPDESAHFGCWLQLENGLYEAKVIFIGNKKLDGKKPSDEYWRRRISFQVPNSTKESENKS
jgi:hypothetical protein